MKICSACLLGIKCRYDGKSRPNQQILALAGKEILIPVCPEQLGGLPTPRTPSEQKGSRVISKDGKDVTKNFRRGAETVLQLARILGVQEAILKQRSPSCGHGQIYDGSFSSSIIEGNGITTRLLKENGIKVITEEDL
ncbi:DUF523 domain-containing protein [bacterium]|nr:MAG: DUF523 domain-containing protein [bacterium]